MHKRLVEHFSVLKDPRYAGKITLRLIDILVLAVCAVIAGIESWENIEMYGKEKADWLSNFLDLQEGIPSHDTSRRLFMILDPDAVERCFMEGGVNFSSIEQHEERKHDLRTTRSSRCCCFF